MEIISELLPLSGTQQSYHCTLVEQPQLEPYWHAHPEIELSLVLQGTGLRFVGDHIGKFSAGDLLLTSHQLPHDRVTESHSSDTAPAKVLVLHLSPDAWQQLPEFQPLRAMMEKARHGLLFPKPSTRFTEKFVHLTSQHGLTGLATLLSLLSDLLSLEAPQPLSSVAFGEGQFASPENHRIHTINQYLLSHYDRPISQKQMASQVAMSPQAFSRWFKRIMNCTFIEHLNKIRVEKACLQLIDSVIPISHISAQCGYDSQSHFNRQFYRLKGCSPGQYRRRFSNRLVS